VTSAFPQEFARCQAFELRVEQLHKLGACCTIAVTEGGHQSGN
jgi:hypothetical protein